MAGTDGADYAMLAADLGTVLFPWQEAVLSDWCSYDAKGNPSYYNCGLDVPRQNGKNEIVEVYEANRLAVCGWHILHTAHRVKTTKRSFRRLAKYFEDPRHPEMRALVDYIRRSNGEEAVFLKNGGSIEFVSRTNGTARGFEDIQLVVYDEAQELTDAQYDAIAYTLSASSTGERQTIYTGTPPNASSPGEVFSRRYRGAMAETSRKTCWSSWATPGLPRRDSSFEDVVEDVYLSNPSMGYVLDIDYTRSEFEGGDIVGFAHERLGWWSKADSATAAIPPWAWEQSAVPAVGDKYRSKPCLGVKFSRDGSFWTLAGCRSDGHGRYAVEVIDEGGTEHGIGDLAEFIEERRRTYCSVAVDGMGMADVLCKELGRSPRGYVLRTGTGDVISAAAGFLEAIVSGKCSHSTQPETDECAARCPRREVGKRGGWSFAPDGDCDSAPLEAMALALWAARNTRRNPRRVQRLQ